MMMLSFAMLLMMGFRL